LSQAATNKIAQNYLIPSTFSLQNTEFVIGVIYINLWQVSVSINSAVCEHLGG